MGRLPCLVLCTTLSFLPGGPPSLSVSAYPSMAVVPLDLLRITARIPPHASNRAFCVGLIDESGVTTRRSCEPLDGEEAPSTHYVFWRDLREPGDYVVLLVVLPSNHRASCKLVLR